MNKFWKWFFYLLVTLFITHLIRDILQIFDVNIPLATFLQTNHKWCRPYCDYATLPHELFGIIASVIILKRKRLGILGVLVLLSLPLWTIGFVMELFGLNG
jgi:hypothetical protein